MFNECISMVLVVLLWSITSVSALAQSASNLTEQERSEYIAKMTPAEALGGCRAAEQAGDLEGYKAQLKKLRPDLSELLDSYGKTITRDSYSQIEIDELKATLNPATVQKRLDEAEKHGNLAAAKADIKRLRPDLAEVVDKYGTGPEDVELKQLLTRLQPTHYIPKQERLDLCARIAQLYEKKGDLNNALRYLDAVRSELRPYVDDDLEGKFKQLRSDYYATHVPTHRFDQYDFSRNQYLEQKPAEVPTWNPKSGPPSDFKPYRISN
jgi:hypothetical protein